MSLNQLTTISSSPYRNVKCNNLVVDGNIKSQDGTVLPGYSLHCTASGKAEFRPRNVETTLSADYLNLSLQDSPLSGTAEFLGFSLKGGFPLTNIQLTDTETITVLNAGRYWVNITISLDNISNGGVIIEADKNAALLPYVAMFIPKVDSTVQGIGKTFSTIVDFLANDTFRLVATPEPFAGSVVFNTNRPEACKISLIKLN